MEKYVSHAASPRVTKIGQWVDRSMYDICWGLMQHLILILTCIIQYIKYLILRIY